MFWQKAMGWQNFKVEDKLAPKRFNEALWQGLMGENTPYPETRHGCDLSRARAELLQAYREKMGQASRINAGMSSVP
jgi:hypothetical protein